MSQKTVLPDLCLSPIKTPVDPALDSTFTSEKSPTLKFTISKAETCISRDSVQN